MTGLHDSFLRPINYLRISVTDRCNLRCLYCMPAERVCRLRHEDILSYEEIYTVAQAAAELGINKVRITGGEPLVRAGLPHLIKLLAGIDALDDISLTTNGTRLAACAAELKQAGLKRVNISLDTLRPERFRHITRRDDNLSDVLAGIEAARSLGLNPVKINTVVMAGINDDELLDFAARTIHDGWHVRFIELMPLTPESTSLTGPVPAAEIRRRLEALGKLEPCLPGTGNGPARYFRFPKAKGSIGFITPVSEHFCSACNRLRLTADGKLRPCLLAEDEIDLKQWLRSGRSSVKIKQAIQQAVASKPRQHHLAEGRVPRSRFFSGVGG